MEDVAKLREQIAEHRAEIDALDEQIVGLLDKRARESIAVRPLKAAVGMGLLDQGREDAILEHVGAIGAGPMRPQDIREIYTVLLKVMKQVPADA